MIFKLDYDYISLYLNEKFARILIMGCLLVIITVNHTHTFNNDFIILKYFNIVSYLYICTGKIRYKIGIRQW